MVPGAEHLKPTGRKKDWITSKAAVRDKMHDVKLEKPGRKNYHYSIGL